jgi:hypothetical protein
MEYGDRVDNVGLHLSSTPLRERSSSGLSTTSSSVFSGTDGAPSSRASSDGHWIDLVDLRLEHGRVRDEDNVKSRKVIRVALEGDSASSMPEDRITYPMQGQKRSNDGRFPRDIPVEKTRFTDGLDVRIVTSGHAKILTHSSKQAGMERPGTSPLRRYRLPLTFILSLILSSYTSSSYILIPLAVLSIVSFLWILLRAISANPIIRVILLFHIAWKATILRLQYPVLFLILSTSLVTLHLTFKYPTTISTSMTETDSTPHSPTCSKTGESRPAYLLMKWTLRTLVVTSIAVLSALPLCCIYSMWDHGEPVFLAVLSMGLFSLSQVMADIAQEILTPPPVTVLVDSYHDTREGPLHHPADDFAVARSESSPKPRSNLTRSCSCSSIGAVSSIRLPTIMTIVGLILQCAVYAIRGVAACAWLLLWGELDAHRVVMYVVKIHHSLLPS